MHRLSYNPRKFRFAHKAVTSVPREAIHIATASGNIVSAFNFYHFDLGFDMKGQPGNGQSGWRVMSLSGGA